MILSPADMSHSSIEITKLAESYGIDAQHAKDLKSQFEKIEAFEAAAESGDWKLFKRTVNQSGNVFLKLMRSSDGDPRLRLPLFQSGELEESFTKSLQNLNRDWTHLMPWWARFGYRFRVALTVISALLVLAAVGAATTGNPGVGGLLGTVALAILIVVDNAEPGIRRSSNWWVRLVYPKPRTLLSRWRTASYIVATLTIMWFMLAPTFKTATSYCDGLSPADRAVLSGCGEDDPFVD